MIARGMRGLRRDGWIKSPWTAKEAILETFSAKGPTPETGLALADLLLAAVCRVQRCQDRWYWQLAGRIGQECRRTGRGLKSVIGFAIGLVNRTQPGLVIPRRTELFDLLAAGRLIPKYADLPLDEITKAIDLVATRSNLGRAVPRAR
jgi:hypothetical protein